MNGGNCTNCVVHCDVDDEIDDYCVVVVVYPNVSVQLLWIEFQDVDYSNDQEQTYVFHDPDRTTWILCVMT